MATQGLARTQDQLALRPPKGWTSFFKGEAFDPVADVRCELVQAVIQCLETKEGQATIQSTTWRHGRKRNLVCQIDFVQLSTLVDGLREAVEHQPEVALQCLRVAVSEHLLEKQLHITQSIFSLGGDLSSLEEPIVVRLTNVTTAVKPIRQLRSDLINRYITLRGTVTRMGRVTPVPEIMPYVCGKCGTKVDVTFEDGKCKLPDGCKGKGCRAKVFEPHRNEALCIDWQKIRLQEILSTDKPTEGQVPRTVDVVLTEDLVSSVVVGDIVSIFGTIKVLATGESVEQYGDVGGGPGPGGPNKKAKPPKQGLFLIYMHAHSVHSHSKAAKAAQDRVGTARPASAIVLTEIAAAGAPALPMCALPNMPSYTCEGLMEVAKFAKGGFGDPFQRLVHSLAPNIVGHELVKAGLVLSLLGGVRKNENVAGRVPIRGDIHVLVVGDPGLGKSQLLQACSHVAPRGVYVCGKTSSGAGLTVSVTKDAVTNDSMFEAGAVLLADQGVCCIDEFDKMSNEHQTLLEVMEQQEVSIAKGGLTGTLPARTTILAAANPVGGHYDKGESVARNLNMSPAMLSRFDLVFILLDRPDHSRDQATTEHVLALHSGVPGRVDTANVLRLQREAQDEIRQIEYPTGQTAQEPVRQPLTDRLRIRNVREAGRPAPRQFFRTYLAYARQYVKPSLSKEAMDRLKEFYTTMRKQVAVPVTVRQMESLVRLTEARARVELRDMATEDDALDVIEIAREVLYDKFGTLDDTVIATTDYREGSQAKGRGKKAEAQRFLKRVRQVAAVRGQDVFPMGQLCAMANEMALKVKDVEAFIHELNDAGELLSKGGGTYQITGVPTDGAGMGTASQATQATQQPPGRAGGYAPGGGSQRWGGGTQPGSQQQPGGRFGGYGGRGGGVGGWGRGGYSGVGGFNRGLGGGGAKRPYPGRGPNQGMEEEPSQYVDDDDMDQGPSQGAPFW